MTTDRSTIELQYLLHSFSVALRADPPTLNHTTQNQPLQTRHKNYSAILQSAIKRTSYYEQWWWINEYQVRRMSHRYEILVHWTMEADVNNIELSYLLVKVCWFVRSFVSFYGFRIALVLLIECSSVFWYSVIISSIGSLDHYLVVYIV